VSAKRTRKIRFFQRDAYVSVDYDAGKVQVFRRIAGSDESSPEIVGHEQEVGESDALRTELEAFVESVRTREPPEVGGAEGKKALQVALRILRKMRTA
jgi:predicted dehydrogenase